jgi:hypothetical protein
MGTNRKPGNKKIIKTNLKTSDRISVVYNNEEVEMSLEDFSSNLPLATTARGYTSFTALEEQSGTGVPTIEKVYENTTGITPTFTRSDPGKYVLNFGDPGGAGDLQYYNTVILHNFPYAGQNDPNCQQIAVEFSNGHVRCQVWDIVVNGAATEKAFTDGHFDGYIEVRIYN